MYSYAMSEKGLQFDGQRQIDFLYIFTNDISSAVKFQ